MGVISSLRYAAADHALDGSRHVELPSTLEVASQPARGARGVLTRHASRSGVDGA